MLEDEMERYLMEGPHRSFDDCPDEDWGDGMTPEQIADEEAAFQRSMLAHEEETKRVSKEQGERIDRERDRLELEAEYRWERHYFR